MKILVSADNPGGAQAIVPVVKELVKKNDVVCVVKNTASDVFAKNNVEFIKSENFIIDRLKEFDLFFYSSSIGLTVDKELLLECKKRDIISVCVLDFWSNYWQRFSSDGNKDFKYLPDYICVMDEYSKDEMIKEGFNVNQLIVTGNPYFNLFTKNIDLKNEDKKRVLFISQPMADDKDKFYNQNDEDQILEDVVSSLPKDYKLVIRLHPRDKNEKYSERVKQNKNVKYEDQNDLEKSISASGLIIGVNSTVMLQAALAGKNVISYQFKLVDKERDCLISNKFGLSRLVTNKEELNKIIDNYIKGESVIDSDARSKTFIVSNATKNILSFIKGLQ